MSDDNLERITILLQARDREFARAMDRMSRKVEKATSGVQRDTTRMQKTVNSRLDSMGTSALSFGKNFAAGLAGGVVAGAFALFTTNLRQTVRGIASIGDEARRAGVDVETFQEWAYVAKENRIAVDALVDGLKELSIRGDEFALTGAGGGAEAFQRLGFSSEVLKEKLKDPSELLLEIFERLEDFDTAAQVRIFDEIMGGTGGERFVQLLAQGADRLREQLATGHEVGAVLDEEVINKADEVDRRFTAIIEKIGNVAKRAVVETAFVVNDAIDRWSGLADAMSTDEAERSAADLAEQYRLLAAEAQYAIVFINDMADAAGDVGDARLADALTQVADAMRLVVDGFAAGEIGADGMRDMVGRLTGAAETALTKLTDINGLSLDDAAAVLDGLRAILVDVQAQADQTAASVAAAAMTEVRPVAQFSEGDMGPSAAPLAPRTSPRPRAAPNDPDFGLPPLPGRGVSGGAGGGAMPRAEFADAVADIEARTRALNVEAAALASVAASGREYADAIEFARTRAELLTKAMADGQVITPALEAQIDALAEAYVTAGQNAEDAAAKMDRVRANTERGIDAMTDLFMGVAQGGDAARAAVARLLVELARVQMQRALLNVSGSGGGGFFGFLGGLLSGGRAGGGSVRAGEAYRINENTPNSEIMVPSRSGGVLNVAQAKDALRDQTGGGTSAVRIELGEGLIGSILSQAQGQTVEIVRAYDGSLSARQAEIARDPRRK